MRNIFRNRRFIWLMTLTLVIITFMCACSGKEKNKKNDSEGSGSTSITEPENKDTKEPSKTAVAEPDATEQTALETAIAATIQPTVVPAQTVKPTKEPVQTNTPVQQQTVTNNPNNGQYTVAIDAGHQGKQNSEKEPIGPGASTTKAKVASGTSGVKSGIAEYIVTLQVSIKIRDILQSKGYNVVMVRESHDVNISNAERAQIANNAGADAFIRIHCNGSENSSVRGALTLCQTSSNPYCSAYYSTSRKLSDCVITSLCSETGLKNRGVSETDTMSGINWCQVPVTIVEMGFMSNPTEDMLLVDDLFQNKLATGIVNGIDSYFEK